VSFVCSLSVSLRDSVPQLHPSAPCKSRGSSRSPSPSFFSWRFTCVVSLLTSLDDDGRHPPADHQRGISDLQLERSVPARTSPMVMDTGQDGECTTPRAPPPPTARSDGRVAAPPPPPSSCAGEVPPYHNQHQYARHSCDQPPSAGQPQDRQRDPAAHRSFTNGPPRSFDQPPFEAIFQRTLMHATDRMTSLAPHVRAHRPSHRSLVKAPNVSVAIGLQTCRLFLILSHLSARSPMPSAAAMGTIRIATKRKAISHFVQPGLRPLPRRRPRGCRRSLHRQVVRPSRSPSSPTLH
jgi:hypothetical protein